MDLRILGMDTPFFSTLQHMMDANDHEADKSFNAPTRTYVRDAKAMASTPADVKEYPSSYAFIIDMPGLKSGDIKVQVEDDNVLVISGERKRGEDKEGAKYVRMERRVGKFMRKFVLPENANTDAISAVCQDGVLTVNVEKLPPPEPKKPKTIEAMFRAIGIGYSRSLPSAAALNWVLKDGLGRLSRCIYTASLASAFDTNLKRVRFTTSVLFSLSIGVELLTPTFPQYFLLLATLANVAKQISLACYLATGSSVHQSFAIADNIGEVSAKAQIQTVCFDNFGLMLAALLNMLLKNNQRLLAGLPFFVYPIFSVFDLYGIYQGLQHVHLQTLTKDRLEIILNSWIDFGHVPSPAEVSKEEGIDFLWTKSKELWPIRIGCLNTNSEMPKSAMMAMQSLTSEDYYFVCMENSYREWIRIKPRGILLCLREGSGTADVMMGLLQACYIRKALIFSSMWETAVEDNDAADLVFKEWFKLIDDSKQSAKGDLSTLKDQMGSLGWALKHILLSTEEQARYSFVDD